MTMKQHDVLTSPEMVISGFVVLALLTLVGFLTLLAWAYWADEVRVPAVSEASVPPPKL
jgi:hypothetical protein